MAYITTTQLANRLGSALYARLTDRTNGATANATVAQEIVDAAEALVNSELARRYQTPVDLAARPELAALLTARTLDVAEFIAWKSSPFVSDIAERVRLNFEEAQQWLTSVARGDLPLPAAMLPASTPMVADGPYTSGGGRVFTSDELDGL